MHVTKSRMKEWVIQIEEKLSRMEPLQTKEDLPVRNQTRLIFKLPANVRKEQDDDSDVFGPYRVSFGPYYHGDERCRPREQDKEDALLHFLRKSNRPLHHYLVALSEVVDELRDAYDQLDRDWREDSESFLRMMLLDGCFLLEFLRLRFCRYGSGINPVLSRVHDNPSEMKCYMHDMLLLENQLPMHLLQTLIIAERGYAYYKDNWGKFLEDIANTFSPKRPWHASARDNHTEFQSSLHILDVYRKCLVHQQSKSRKLQNRPKIVTKFHFNIPSATELHKVGIEFTASHSTSPVDILFRRKNLVLPHISIDGSTKSTILNLIAFEHVHKHAGNEVTSYVYFMGCLVQGADDVSLLQSRGVINTALPCGEVARLFDRLSKDACLEPDNPVAPEYLEVGKMVRRRYNKLSDEWRKDLFQTYLKSPWTVISVVAATLLFTLSIIQTVYSVLSYVHPK